MNSKAFLLRTQCSLTLMVGLSMILLMGVGVPDSTMDTQRSEYILGGLENCDCIEEGPECFSLFPSSCETHAECRSCRDWPASLHCEAPETDGEDCFITDPHVCVGVWYDVCHQDGYCWDGREGDDAGAAEEKPTESCSKTMNQCTPYYGPHQPPDSE